MILKVKGTNYKYPCAYLVTNDLAFCPVFVIRNDRPYPVFLL